MSTRKPFDRAARDRLHRHPVVVVEAGDRVMLIGDSRAEHVLVDPSTMRSVASSRRGIFGVAHRFGKRVRITESRRERRAATR